LGAFIDTLTNAMVQKGPPGAGRSRSHGSLGAWLMSRVRSRKEDVRRVRVVEQVRVTPRQGVALIEVEGELYLMPTGEGGVAAIFPVKKRATRSGTQAATQARTRGPVAIPIVGSCA
jgi:hypothetical protein